MFFHSVSSLVLFLPIVFSIYPLLNKRYINASNIFLLLFSLIFYAYDIPWFIIPLLISSVVDYLVSKRLINDKKVKNGKRKIFLIISLIVNIGLLIIFKYSIFISSTIPFIQKNFEIEGIKSFLLPAGISFYTFQTLSFSIDAYKRKIKIMPKFLDYFLYVCYFPQLVAGPILRPKDFFNHKSELLINKQKGEVNKGFSRICFGLFLKLVMADELGRLNDIAYLYNFNNLSFFDSWTMAFGFGLQIYFDFSAYSHMAIGISNILGLPIKENFNFPYSSLSATSFWKKWHISLSSWVKDYLYRFLNNNLPLYFFGLLPLLITWAIMGLWHGASWRFAMWGLINGIFIIIHRIFKNWNINFSNNFINHLSSWVLTIFPIMSTWIFFRSTSWEQANNLYLNLFRIDKLELGLPENYYLIVLIFLFSTLIIGYFKNFTFFKKAINNEIIKILISSIALGLSFLFINTQNSFIYFQF